MKFDGVIESLTREMVTGWANYEENNKKFVPDLVLKFHSLGSFRPSQSTGRGDLGGFAFRLPPSFHVLPWKQFIEEFDGIIAFRADRTNESGWRLPLYKTILIPFNPDTSIKKNLSKKWNVVVVAIIKNEALYLTEWLIFHLSIGVEHFLLYDNGSNDQTTSILEKFINAGIVTLIYWPARSGQIDAYNHALRMLAHSTEWIGYIDIDEFVVLKNHDYIFQYLESLSTDQVLLPWRNFPYDGHFVKPGGTTMENFFWAHRSESNSIVQVKHFVRSTQAERVTAHFSIMGNKQTKIADGTIISPPDARIIGPTYEGAQINHYATRSFRENQQRLDNGQVDGEASKRLANFAPLSPDLAAQMEYDASILRHFAAYAKEVQVWARLSKTPHRYGLGQRRPILLSWGPALGYFAKSFGNYLLEKDVVLPKTDFGFYIYKENIENKETKLVKTECSFEGDSTVFACPEANYLRFFQGTTHYGDFVRRLGFNCLSVSRMQEISDSWIVNFTAMHNNVFVIFDISALSTCIAKLSLDNDANLSTKITIPSGRYAGAFYLLLKLDQDTRLILEITGTGLIREVIVGTLP